MKLWIFICLTITSSARICIAQNLVPNPSFEEYSDCPTKPAQLNELLYWFNPAVHPGLGGTPDYFNVCASPSSNVDVPNNFGGYQLAHSGMGYSGLISYNYQTNYNYHEFIEAPLTSTLEPNACYHFKMYVNLANNSPVTSDAIGVYFSDTIISGINYSSPLPFTPQIINTNGYIRDTMNWIPITGEYIATGTEKYLIIGNYTDDINTNYITVNSCCMHCAYFYIDDVSLEKCSSNGIHENSNSQKCLIYPNPMNQRAVLRFNNEYNEKCVLTLYDSVGQIVLKVLNTGNSELVIERGNLQRGLYFYQLKSNNRIIATGNLVME